MLHLLPSDVLSEIVSYLTDKSDILRLLKRTSRCLQQEQNDIIWKVLCKRDNIHASPIPQVSYEHLWLHLESTGDARSLWLLRYNTKKLCWEFNSEEAIPIIQAIQKRQISVITAVDLDDKGNSDKILNTLLGIDQAFPEERSMDQWPCLYMWGKPYIIPSQRKISKNQHEREPDTKDVIFLRAYGLFDKDQDFVHDESLNLRKALLSMIMLLSSTVILCKHETNATWMQDLDEIMELVVPPLFGTQADMRSLLVCTSSEQETHLQAYDVLNEASQLKTKFLDESPFLSCLVNWFGKIHGILMPPNVSEFRSDLWSFVQDVNYVLNFGWPMSRWERMKPFGPVCAKYVGHCVNECNKRHNSVNVYEKIISKFGREFLNQEMEAATEFYRRAVSAELNTAVPLEMEQLVQVSEMHAESALRSFSQSVSPALFCHQVIDEYERHLKQGINTIFRPIWRENGQNSENYCQQIFDSCFKWAKAEYDCPSKPATEFKKRFFDNFHHSLKLYMDNAKGTRKYQIMSFCSKLYLDMILQIYPDMKHICEKISLYVEHQTMQQNVEMDKERTVLQKLSGYNLRLITVENAIQRLREEIQARTEQAKKSDEFQSLMEDKLEKMNLKKKSKKEWRVLRQLFIDSACIQLEQELQRKQELEAQYAAFQMKLQYQPVPSSSSIAHHAVIKQFFKNNKRMQQIMKKFSSTAT
jgi:hypothetical protein